MTILANFDPAHPADQPAVVRLHDEPGGSEMTAAITQAVFTHEGVKLHWFREDAAPVTVQLAAAEMATLAAAWQEYRDALDDWNSRKEERELQAIEEARALAASSLVFLKTKAEEDYQIQIFQDKGSELWSVTVPTLTLLLDEPSDFYLSNLLPGELPSAVRTMLSAIEKQVRHWEGMPQPPGGKPGARRFCEAYRCAQARASHRTARAEDSAEDAD